MGIITLIILKTSLLRSKNYSAQIEHIPLRNLLGNVIVAVIRKFILHKRKRINKCSGQMTPLLTGRFIGQKDIQSLKRAKGR